MRAAVVEPVDRKANWSEKFRFGEVKGEPDKKDLTTILSITLDITEVIEIGLKSDAAAG